MFEVPLTEDASRNHVFAAYLLCQLKNCVRFSLSSNDYPGWGTGGGRGGFRYKMPLLNLVNYLRAVVAEMQTSLNKA